MTDSLSNYRPYNPLDKENLGESVLRELLRQPIMQMPPPRPIVNGKRQSNRHLAFVGAGVYAIYYVGQAMPFMPYEPVATRNRGGKWEQPIYVGKANPGGSRSGDSLVLDPKYALFDRLTLHSESIDYAENLDLQDFYCRYLCVDDAYISLGEIVVIQQLGPLWNKVGQGFGSKVVGRGRKDQKRSRWDTIHPGRPGTGEQPNTLSMQELLNLVSLELAGELGLEAESDEEVDDDEDASSTDIDFFEDSAQD